MKKVMVNVIVLALMFTVMASGLLVHGWAATDLNIKYGKATIKAKLLDDFTDSVVNQATVWRDGTVEMKDGRALGKSASICDSYEISVPNANSSESNKNLYRNALYIGFEIENKSNGSVYYVFQGRINGSDAFFSPVNGAVLVDMNGNIQEVNFTPERTVYERYAYLVPAGFKGYAIFPTASVVGRNDWETPIWNGSIELNGVAFHASTGQNTVPKGTATNIEFYIDNFFVIANELPNPSVENPETSDTLILLPMALLLAAVLLIAKESGKRYYEI